MKKRLQPNLPKSWPCTIADGLLELNGVVTENEIPLPLENSGNVRLKLEVVEPDGSLRTLELTGRNAYLRLIGDADYLEDFSGPQ